MLHALLQLASDTSAEGRRRLLFAVTDLFLKNLAHSADAIEHFTVIANTSVENLGSGDKAAYAARVASETGLPPDVAMKLARDPDVAVAAVILRLSPVLSDEDLAAIASTHSAQHLLAIAERTTLAETVTDALLSSGDDAAIRKVSGNEQARLSRRGIADLLKRSKEDRTILENLSKRSRSAPIVSQMPLPGANGSAQSAHPFTRDKAGSASKVQARRRDAASLLDDLRSGSRSLDEVASLLAKEDRAFDLARVLGTLSGVTDAEMLRILLEPDSDGIAAACASVGLTREGFTAVLKLRAARLHHGQRQVDRALAAFDDLPRDKPPLAIAGG